jgi:hypothetical protein
MFTSLRHPANHNHLSIFEEQLKEKIVHVTNAEA